MTVEGGISIIVPAAGSGSRLKSRTAKPYVVLEGIPLIIRTLKNLERKIENRLETLVAVEKKAVLKMSKLIHKHRLKRCRIVEGGSTRAESVKKAFNSRSPESSLVLIHDGARPFIKKEPISVAIKSARKVGAVILAKSADATVKQVARSSYRIQATLDRTQIYLAQTPQIFTAEILRKAYHKLGARYGKFTDEAGLVEAAGFLVEIIPGSSMNFKITTSEDLAMAKLLIKNKKG